MPPSRSDGVGVKAGRKPGSVLPSSGRGVIIYLGPSSPAASSGSQSRNVEDGQPFVPRPCSQPGFTEPAPLDAAGALLPHPCTLACAGEPAIGGVFLWHSPHGHPHWALPSKPGHRGARTFLNRIAALGWTPIAITSPAFKPHNDCCGGCSSAG